MYERHPLGDTCRSLDQLHDHADCLWLRVYWGRWFQGPELVREPAGSGRPLCDDEEKSSGKEMRYGPSRRAKGFFEATDMVEGGFEDGQ